MGLLMNTKALKAVHMAPAHRRNDTRVYIKECRTLAQAGFAVSLIVADNKGDHLCDGVSIYDVGKATNRLDRIFGVTNRVLRKAQELNADVYHFHDPELLRIALRLKGGSHRSSIVYDSHEDFPRQLESRYWIPSPLRKTTSFFAEILEDHVAKRLTGVIAATPHIASRFARLNGNTVNINNYPLPHELAPLVGVQRRANQICYIGGISWIRGLKTVIEALPRVPHVRLVLCGPFNQKAHEAELRSLPGWKQVDYRGSIRRDDMQQVLSESIAGLVTLLPVPNCLEALPNKIFEYMSAGLAVIASDFPHWRDMMQDTGAGILVDPESVDSMAFAIESITSKPEEAISMGRSGREAVLARYNWATEADKLLAFYRERL